MSNIAETINASGYKEFGVQGDFLRLMVATGDVEIVYYKNGAEIARTGKVKAGYAETFRGVNFTSLRVYDKSGAGNAVEFVYRLGGDVRYDRSVGSVDITALTPTQAETVGQVQSTVTNASGLLLAARAGREYLLIQNKDPAGIVYLNLAGAAATVAGGVKLPAGGSFELNCNILTGAIYAIGDIASNANVIVVEGY